METRHHLIFIQFDTADLLPYYPTALRERISSSVGVHSFLIVGAWLSLVERLVRDREVGGSNPLAPTNNIQQNEGKGCSL